MKGRLFLNAAIFGVCLGRSSLHLMVQGRLSSLGLTIVIMSCMAAAACGGRMIWKESQHGPTK